MPKSCNNFGLLPFIRITKFGLITWIFSREVKGGGVDEVSPTMISTVTCALQMILMLEEWRPISLSSVAMVVKITRLMCVFLTGL